MANNDKPEIKHADAIRFTDREAVRLVEEEATRTGETMAKVASRVIIKYFTLQHESLHRHTTAAA